MSNTDDDFHADGVKVYGFRYGAKGEGERVNIATAESPSWAETIADALNNDPDAYIA